MVRMMNPTAELTQLETLAAHLHELFTSLMAAGFTETQALTLVIGLSKQHGDSD